MSCCTSNSCSGTNIFFSRWSKSFAKRFRKKGLEKVQRYLLEGIRLEPVKDRHILDIGCGVGALHLTLLQEGAILATGIEAAEGMLEKAKEFQKKLTAGAIAELEPFGNKAETLRQFARAMLERTK